MQAELDVEKIRNVLKISRTEPVSLIELIQCVNTLEKEGQSASYKKVIMQLWPEEWKTATDKVAFETSKWDLLRKRRRKINQRLLESPLCLVFYIDLTQEKTFRIVQDPEEIKILRQEEPGFVGLQEKIDENENNHHEKTISRVIRSSKRSEAMPLKSSHGKRRWRVTGLVIVLLIAPIFFFFPRHPNSTDIRFEKPADERQLSIAILPFAFKSDDAKVSYLAEGLTEETRAAFSRFSNLYVTARSSGSEQVEKSTSGKSAGKILGVQYVLEGSLRVSDGTVHAYAQISDVVADEIFWAGKWDRGLEDYLDLQHDIVLELLMTFQLEAGAGEKARVLAEGTRNFEAYAKLLKAYSHFVKGSQMDALHAQKLCEEAIALDPGYATAYAIMADTYLAEASPKDGTDKWLNLALDAVQKALTLNEQDPLAHIVLSRTCWFRGDKERALREAENAVSLSPNFVEMINWYAMVLAYTGKYDEAIELFQRSIRLEPDHAWFPLLFVGSIQMKEGEYNSAENSFKAAIQQHPERLEGPLYLTACYSALGRMIDARLACQKVLQVNPNFRVADYMTATSTELLLTPLKSEAFSKLLQLAGLP